MNLSNSNGTIGSIYVVVMPEGSPLLAAILSKQFVSACLGILQLLLAMLHLIRRQFLFNNTVNKRFASDWIFLRMYNCKIV